MMKHLIFIPLSAYSIQRKCEQYWNEDLDKPYNAGRGFTVVTTEYKTFADFAIRDMTIHSVSTFGNQK